MLPPRNIRTTSTRRKRSTLPSHRSLVVGLSSCFVCTHGDADGGGFSWIYAGSNFLRWSLRPLTVSYTAARSGIGALARVFPPIRWLGKAAGVGAQAIACVHVAMFMIYVGLRTLSTMCVVVCAWDDFVRSKEGANSVEVRQ